MTRPRRSQQARSVRSFLRSIARDEDTPTTYRAVGRTLITEVAQRENTAGLARRLTRAETAVRYFEQSIARFEQGPGEPFSVLSVRQTSVRAHRYALALALDRATLCAAEAELAAAQRSASRPVGDLATPPLVSLPQPRTWPNAAPGGTSPRRASRTLAVAWDAFEQYRESLHDRASL